MLSVIYTGIAAMIVLPLTNNQMTRSAVFLMISHNLVQGGDYPGKVRPWWPKRGYFQQDLIQLSLSKHGVDPAIGAQLNYQLFYLTGVNNVPKNPNQI